MKLICGLFNLFCAIALFVISAQNNGEGSYGKGTQFAGGTFLYFLGMFCIISWLQDRAERIMLARQRAEREAEASEEAELRKFLDSPG